MWKTIFELLKVILNAVFDFFGISKAAKQTKKKKKEEKKENEKKV